MKRWLLWGLLCGLCLNGFAQSKEAKYVIDGEKFLSKGKNTPFNGTEVYGKIAYTIVDGEVKYSAE